MTDRPGWCQVPLPDSSGRHHSQEGAMSTPAKPSIVFAHGIWADGSCFSKVILGPAAGEKGMW